MKRKIFGYFCIIGAVSAVLTALLGTILFYGIFQKQVRDDLRTAAQLLNYSDVSAENRWTLRSEVSGVRVTLIATDGGVLFDTEADPVKMENHLNRPEVSDALLTGQGEAVRASETLGKNTFYYAVRLTDGSVLRLSKDANNVFSVFAGAFSGVFLVVLFVLGLALIVSGKLTRRIVAPLEDMAAQLELKDAPSVYDELAPFARALREREENIRAQMERLKLQQRQIRLITGSMDEGIILLDQDKNILLANDSAARLLDAPKSDYTGKSLHYLSRGQELAVCTESAANGENRSEELSVGERRVQILASPVYRKNAVAGVMCVLLDVTERGKNEKLRREFTANVSHELKTPLTSICGYAELLAAGAPNSEDAKEFGGKIHREALRLLSLITDIIKLSELDDLPASRAVSDCPLLSLARDCAAQLEPAAQKRGVALSVDGDDCVIPGDAAMLEQLMLNLIDNAIRYNKPDGGVFVSVRRGENAAVLRVRDTGIGIPPEHQERVFERFYRVDKSRSKATGGTGLGLAIVKHIAGYHKAEITLTSGEDGTEICVAFSI